MIQNDDTRSGGQNAQPDFLSFDVLTKRSDFLRCARGRRIHSNSFVLQGWNRHDDGPARVGYTCSKKVGNAVARNRAKRRLREVVRMALPLHGKAGWDYVVIGRASVTATTPLPDMIVELEKAFIGLGAKR